MNVAPTMDANMAFAEKARPIGAKRLANEIRSSYRTSENWLAGKTGPQWAKVREMLQNDELACMVLRAAARDDIAELIELKRNAEAMRKYLTKGIAAE